MSLKTYISCASWEERFTQSISQDYEKYKFDKIVLLYFQESCFFNLSSNNIEIAEAFASQHNISIVKVPLTFNDQIKIYNKVEQILSTLSKSNYYLNVTTMPRHLIYICLDFLTINQHKFEVLYYIPNSYGSEIAKNPDIPQLVIKHSGIFEADKETLLIISAGLDKERIFQLYYYFEPYKTIILEEKQNYSEIKKEKQLDFQKSLSEISNVDFFEINSFVENNIFNFMQSELISDIKIYNTLLCAIGPKIASLEFFKFNKFYPNTGIVYALSQDYSKDYSIGLDKEHIFSRTSNFFRMGG